jgi:hypothetical protein
MPQSISELLKTHVRQHNKQPKEKTMEKVIINDNNEWECPLCGASEGFNVTATVLYDIIEDGKEYDLEENEMLEMEERIMCNSCASEVDFPEDVE